MSYHAIHNYYINYIHYTNVWKSQEWSLVEGTGGAGRRGNGAAMGEVAGKVDGGVGGLLVEFRWRRGRL